MAAAMEQQQQWGAPRGALLACLPGCKVWVAGGGKGARPNVAVQGRYCGAIGGTCRHCAEGCPWVTMSARACTMYCLPTIPDVRYGAAVAVHADSVLHVPWPCFACVRGGAAARRRARGDGIRDRRRRGGPGPDARRGCVVRAEGLQPALARHGGHGGGRRQARSAQGAGLKGGWASAPTVCLHSKPQCCSSLQGSTQFDVASEQLAEYNK